MPAYLKKLKMINITRFITCILSGKRMRQINTLYISSSQGEWVLPGRRILFMAGDYQAANHSLILLHKRRSIYAEAKISGLLALAYYKTNDHQKLR